MKKRILSILLTLIMMVCLMPTAVQAEEGEAEYTIESREGSSTTETAPQSEGGEYTEEVQSVSQNGETSTAEIFSSTNATNIASQTVSVGSKEELVAALADTTMDIVQLDANISLGGGVTLTVAREVTLDLNGYVLKGSGRSVFEIKDGGHMIVTDSRPTEKHKFWVNNSYSYGVWNWNDQGGDEDKTVLGGAITGGYDVDGGGGVKVRDGGRLTMNGGNIVGCGSSSAEGGGVKVYDGGVFEMNGNAAIVGCAAQSRDGGGVYVAEKGTFVMNSGTIRDCVSRGVGSGGGVCNKGKFTMNGGTIRNCAAPAGGAVYHYNYSGDPLTLNGTIISDNSDQWQPVYVQSDSTVTIGAAADIQANMFLMNCTVLTNGGVVKGDVYIYNNVTFSVGEGVTQSTIFYSKITVNHNYNVNGVAVTYQVNGADYATQFLNSGSRATQPADPTKPGYTFDGWYKTDGTKWDFDTAVAENITLAGWQYLPVDNASALENALADATVDVIRLTKDIDISSSLTILRPITFDLNGYVLRYTNTNTVGSVFKIVTGGDLTVIDSRPEAEHKFNDDDVLWVLDEQNGKEIVKGGVITGGTGTLYYPDPTLSYTTKLGGGVYMEGGQFTMNGGNIVGCEAHSGGGVYILKDGAFIMNGGSIVGCSGILVDAAWNPLFGGVYLCDGGTFTMTGGVIKSRTVYSVNLIDNATMNANGGEIYGVVEAAENSSITCLDGLTGVTIFRDLVALRNDIDHVDWGLFYGKLYALETSISGLTVTYKDGDTDYAKQILASGKTATKPDDPAKSGYRFDGWRTADGTPWDYTTPVTEDMTLTAHWIINTREVTNEQELKDAMADTSMGQICLIADMDISQNLSVTRAVILDLNGHVLRQITNNCVSFKVESGGDLTLIDSNPTAEHRFTPDSDGLWVWDETGGTKTVKGGVITGNAQGRSGSIHVEEGTFTMTAGNLVGCNVYGASSSIGISCGAVYVAANSKFNMTGGAIQGCLVRQGNGGGVYVNGGQFTMTGGAITDCTVDGLGGGVYVLAGTFKLDGGDIRGCTAGGGGGVFVYMKGNTRGVFEMTGGSIADCTAKYGSALYLYNGIMYADGGTVDGTVYVDGRAYPDTDSRITTNGITGVTSFKKGAKTLETNSRIEYGIFYGGITGDGTVSGVTMTYLINDAEYAKQMLPSAGLATRPDDPAAKTGYTFGGWNKADGTAWDYVNDTVTGDITLYAKWTPNTYKLIFNTNGGSDATPKNVTYGELFGELPVPVREGYVFMGWFDAQESTQYDATTRLDKDEDITLYAKWTSCDHKSSTKQPNCTESAICTECAGTIPALGHNFGTPDYKWNGTECTAHRVCANDASHEESETVTAAVKVLQNKDCELDELSTYTATFTNPAFAAQTKQNVVTANKLGHDFTVAQHDETQHWNKCSRCDATDTKVNHTGGKATCTEQAVCTVCGVKYGNALGHAYSTPDYKWNGIECTAHRVCANDASHEESETVTATVKVIQNKDCELDELSTYTATFTNPAFAAETKQNVVTANKLGHDFTVAQHDKTQHWNKCSRCDATDTKADHTGGKATCTEQAVCTVCNTKYGNALGHNFKVPQHNETQHWNKCSRCNATDKKADHTGGKATCTERAVCTVCGVKYGNAFGHAYSTPDYTWNGTECTAHRVCANDASHKESETVTAVVNVTQSRGCVQDELSAYTATFKNKAFATQTKQNVVTANKLGHDFTAAQHDEKQHWNKCSRCDATDTKANHTGGKATCIEQAVCEVCHSPYGEFNGTNHIGGTKIRNRKSQNCTENGYTGDTYCKGCGKKLSSGTVISADGHKGGTASCTDKAECEVCHEKYGEPDENNHIELEKVNATPATAASTGTIEHWRCTACGKVFADADGKREISSEDTVAKKLAPSILDGANGKWKKGDENGLTFKSDAAFSDFVEVLVNGKTVAPENYTKREDGIIVDLKASYLETLAEGEYTLTICSAGGDATTEFMVEAGAVSTSTDSTNIGVWVIIGIVALGAGIAIVVLVVRKRKTV